MKAFLVALLLVATAAAGCLGGAKPETVQEANLKPKEITQDAEKRFEELTQVIPSNYTFAGQRLLDPIVAWFNDTIDSAADTGFESPSDDGGFNFTTIPKTMDVSQHIPVGQAVEIHITLWWSGNPGQSVDLDILTDLPGSVGAFDPSTGQEMNWNVPVKRLVVNTVGVAGQKPLIGVQATNGRIAPGQTVEFHLSMAFDYARDVLTPYHPWAFQVPDGATGIVLHSEKITGDEHIQAAFSIISPTDDLVQFVEYDDIAIPTESVFIPLRQPGEYIFYAYFMTGGFLSLKADAPVPVRDVRALALTEESAVDFNNPAAPGIVEHNLTVDTGLGSPADGLNVATPYQEGSNAGTFSVDKAFPLRVLGWFGGGQTVAGDAEVRISNDAGVVYDAVRGLRADFGDQGSIGWTGDHAPFVSTFPGRLHKGSFTVSVVSDGYTGQIGHTILSYDRSAGGN